VEEGWETVRFHRSKSHLRPGEGGFIIPPFVGATFKSPVFVFLSLASEGVPRSGGFGLSS